MHKVLPANKEEFPVHPETPHGHQEAADSHALAKTHHHTRFGETLS